MITFMKRLASAVPTPAAGKVTYFVDSTSGFPSFKDEAGVVTTVESTGNKVTAFSTPTDVQYPSAKLVNDSLALKSTAANPVFTGGLSISGQSLTGSQATPLFSGSANWNTTGAPSLIYARATDTASNANASLIDVGTAALGSLFIVRKDGRIIGDANSSMSMAGGFLNFYSYGINSLNMGSTTLSIGINGSNNGSIQLSSTTGTQTIFAVEGNGVWAQRNSTNAQQARIYNTYTDASNYERAYLKWATNVFDIGVEALGTGTTRTMRLNRLKGTTAAGTPTLGANCPATTLTAPYQWIEVTTSDGSTAYIPAWK